MKTIYHPANSRGHANHGWLNSHHSFSFASYYNPDRMNFGALRVLNDDKVAAGRGFGSHPHDNMEIISIPLSGELEHQDNIGNKAVIKAGDVQVMSAGTGVVHSEYNRMQDKEVKFLQIWVIPNKRNVTPRYDQITLDKEVKPNSMQQILSPNPDDKGVWIHQDAWFHLAQIETGKRVNYTLKKKDSNGVYVLVLDGSVHINGQELNTRDALGIWEAESFEITASNDARILLMEVPMQF
ncbi:pirin family protein [Reichenbachiella agarivorans]|uniref:Pirin family protein n=1 Tax=Reichenbachiella agarivorans TaxID=2979464 RepID=A0ABY6CXQ4_9BACT|nr:pirin family protein [Reichenbachiella agarivorans]UXP34183.1 pirin family protein [Reichenbachiella agarivorans]